MTNYTEQLAVDFANRTLSDLRKHYDGQIKDGTTIQEVVVCMQKLGLLNNLIRSDWRNNGLDRDGLYLINDGQRFQVFVGERGIKNWLEEFQDLPSACSAWLDAAFNELDYLAPDSKIG